MDKEKILTAISTNLRELMNRNEISSRELARKCDISSGTISKILQGQMSITIPMAINISEGLGVNLSQLLQGLTQEILPVNTQTTTQIKNKKQISIGVMSISNKRYTSVTDSEGKVIGHSELEGGLDLTETSGNLIQLIQESVQAAFHKNKYPSDEIKNAKINLVTQSYEFEDTREKFTYFAKKYFKDVILMPDWILTYLVTFQKTKGISLVVDKGVSLSYVHNDVLKKLGGWKFPVYDFGGENWLGAETIHHTIDVFEGYEPPSKLADSVLSKFGGKIEKITEICFKGSKDPDVYCLFSEILLRCYFTDEPNAVKIVENGFNKIYRSINKVDEILGEKVKITINGSLADIYKKFFDKKRLIEPASNAEKVVFLAGITREYLDNHYAAGC